MAWGLTDEGLVLPRTADFLAEIRDAYEGELGVTVDWARDSVLGPLTAIMADRLNALSEAVQAVYDAGDENGATGVHLDNLGALSNTPRLEATYSIVTVAIRGTVGTVIPAGKRLQGGGADGLARWTLLTDTTLVYDAEVDTGLGVVEARAVDIGSVAVGTNELEMLDIVGGVDLVTNGPSVTGRERETNPAYRLRRRQALATGDGRTTAALRARLQTVSGIDSAMVIDNKTDSEVVTGGITLPPHSVAVVLYPATAALSTLGEIGRIIWEGIAPGVSTVGTDFAVNITSGGITETVVFDFAAEVEVDVSVTVDLTEGYVLADVEEEITEEITAYLAGLAVGKAARFIQIARIVGSVEGVDGATILLDGGAADVEVDLFEQVVLGTLAVT